MEQPRPLPQLPAPNKRQRLNCQDVIRSTIDGCTPQEIADMLGYPLRRILLKCDQELTKARAQRHLLLRQFQNGLAKNGNAPMLTLLGKSELKQGGQEVAAPTIREPRFPKSPNCAWGRRWRTLRFHTEQWRLWSDPTRFKVVPAGRRSGKTELAKRWLVQHLFRPTWHGFPGRYFAAAPTREQAKRIFWHDIKALLPRVWTAATSETQLMLRTTNGAELHVIGLDKPMRLEGVPWDGCVIDELADCKAGIWDANIRPALADRKGWAWLIGVPDLHGPSQIEYQRLYQLGLSQTDPEWRAFTWPSSDILPAAEVESARARMDPRLFEQEFMGKFIVAGGRAFPDFDVAIHVKPTAYQKDLPLCWSLDFNINPMCSGVLQHRAGMIYVIDEFTLPDTRTDYACDAFLERAKQQGWNLHGLTIYGDASGSARDSTSGISDWTIVGNRLKQLCPKMKVPRANPPIKDTINAVNARLLDAAGGVHVCIDPRCLRLIEDLNTALWPGDLEPHHALSWFRYFAEREYPIMNERDGTGGVVATL